MIRTRDELHAQIIKYFNPLEREKMAPIGELIAKIYSLPEYTTAQKMHIKKLRDVMSTTYLRERVIKRSKLYEFIDSLGVSDLYEYDSSCNALSNDNRDFSHMENGIKFKEEFKDKAWGKRKRLRNKHEKGNQKN